MPENSHSGGAPGSDTAGGGAQQPSTPTDAPRPDGSAAPEQAASGRQNRVGSVRLFETDPIPDQDRTGIGTANMSAEAMKGEDAAAPSGIHTVTREEEKAESREEEKSEEPISSLSSRREEEKRGAPNSGRERQSLGFARSIGWVTLLLLVVLSVVLSSYFGSTARETLLSRQQKFATLLADYLNNQIYRRFTLPTVSFFGRITLSKQEQYKALDQIIQSITNGLQVEGLRIYAHDYTVTYSTDHGELGKKRFLPSVEAATRANSPIFEIDASMPYWQALFRFSLGEGSFRMRTTYPLRIENRMGSADPEGPVMGVLEFSQDISSDIESAVRFQQLIVVVTLACSCILFGLLLMFIRRAERDLTARMYKEQQLVNELHQHEKLAGMGRVVASIAHEIRNPLGIISSSAELLLKRPSGTDTVTSRILQAIYDEAKRLSRTVNDFLDYARPRMPDMQKVDVAQVVSQALVFLEPEIAQRDIGVVRTGALDSPLWVRGDKDLLYRAFYNIMGNAIQAMGSSGSLTVTLLPPGPDNDVVTLIFQDSGPGFPEEHLNQLLDPFFTTKDDGTGLGLPIVNSILSSHQGTLALSNAAEGGAVATVTLPAAG